MEDCDTKIELLINGKDTPAESGRSYDRLDPVTGEVETTAAAASVADVGRAVASAAKAFEAWSKTGPGERRTLLMKAADIMEAKVGDFIAAMISETGATGLWAGFNVKLAAGMIREAASLVTQIGGEIIPSDKPNTLAMGVLKPKGVCLGIAPWNAPVILGTRAVAVPIACGNTVVLKASELCPATHRLIGECFAEAGMPEGVLNVVSNRPEEAAEIVEALIADPRVHHVKFTGSSRVGRIIGRLAGEHLKPSLLELGGKAGIAEFTDLRWVTIEDSGQHYPF
ncbi:aldehyde dehydrogenase family protein [Ciceribacter lividus]|uniref:Aldehyde dehydrogenase family protein n=1 Tax=Ciceribacter lividus TaxID=1197950 RepID=A0A6I7HHH3_9HYPH|nr:aldehyde dehydrogenase family protein [Ciceribacter lividus]